MHPEVLAPIASSSATLQLRPRLHACMQVPDEDRDRAKAGTEYPTLVLYDVRLAISLTL